MVTKKNAKITHKGNKKIRTGQNTIKGPTKNKTGTHKNPTNKNKAKEIIATATTNNSINKKNNKTQNRLLHDRT